jgi:hypothetical protein
MFRGARLRTILTVIAMMGAAASMFVTRSGNAEPFVASFILEFSSPDGSASEPLRLSVLSRCLGDTIIYKIKNEGQGWPDQASLAFFRYGENAPLIFRDMLPDEGQVATFRIFSEQPYPVIDMRIKAPWLGHSIFHRSQHKKPRVQGQKNGRKSGKTFKRHLAYIE